MANDEFDLQAWRKRMGGWTRNEAAIKLGCSANSIRNWEEGKTATPRYIGYACKWMEYQKGRDDGLLFTERD